MNARGAAAKAVITFEDFEPGTVLGESAEVFESALAQGWRDIFGDRPEDGAAGAAEGAGIAVVMMMRAYLAVVAPRPPGNIHAGQQFTLAAAPRIGEQLRTVVSCVGKELKRGRRHVVLRAEGTGDGGRPVYTGCMTLIWAA